MKGGELARSQIDRGADVVYAAAGATGLGVLRAAADAGKLGVGVDSNQDSLFPGKILTSMLKRVDNAVQATITDYVDGNLKGGIETFGLAEGGVDYAQNEYNKELLGDIPTTLDELKALSDKIAASGKKPWCAGIASGDAR